MTRAKLGLDPAVVRKARTLAKRAAAPVEKLARTHTTVSVERATLRLAGLTGADGDGMPWVNHLVDAVRRDVGLEHGALLPVFHALRSTGHGLGELAQEAASGAVSFRLPVRT
jgi:beta-lysine 5,6-aminomutase alpha subunit